MLRYDDVKMLMLLAIQLLLLRAIRRARYARVLRARASCYDDDIICGAR